MKLYAFCNIRYVIGDYLLNLRNLYPKYTIILKINIENNHELKIEKPYIEYYIL
jgi:hypothetical protein